MFKTSDEAFPTIYNQALIKVTDGILREGWGRAPAMKEWSAGLFTSPNISSIETLTWTQKTWEQYVPKY